MKHTFTWRQTESKNMYKYDNLEGLRANISVALVFLPS